MIQSRMNIAINIGEKEISFTGGFLNNEGFIEFDAVNDIYQINSLYQDGRILCRYQEMTRIINLKPQDTFKIEKYKKNILDQLKALFKDILSGKERIMYMYLGDDSEYKYISTTMTDLEHGLKSPKYTNALTYSFSDKVLSEGGYKGLSITNNSEMQILLSRTLEAAGVKTDEKGIGFIKYKDLLELIFNNENKKVA